MRQQVVLSKEEIQDALIDYIIKHGVIVEDKNLDVAIATVDSDITATIDISTVATPKKRATRKKAAATVVETPAEKPEKAEVVAEAEVGADDSQEEKSTDGKDTPAEEPISPKEQNQGEQEEKTDATPPAEKPLFGS